MSDSVRALRVYNEQGSMRARLEESSMSAFLAATDPGDVTVRVHYSSINYKDALGVTGKGKIYKKFPIIGGIDASGVVSASEDKRFPVGSSVLVTGCGFGEVHDGGYADYARVPGDWLVQLPEGLSLRDAMALGTAGFTAALCIARMEDNGQKPLLGPIVVTGASGGVGSFAVNMLAQLGYEVVAVSGKPEQHEYLHRLGAAKVIPPENLVHGAENLGHGARPRPLESVQWGGAIDNVGGELLAALAPCTQLWGNIACVGMAASAELHTTVMPLILRGVSLLGVSSNNCPYPRRHGLWQRLANDLKPKLLGEIARTEVALSQIENAFADFLARKVVGRVIVDCQK